jgi:phytoene desaturase
VHPSTSTQPTPRPDADRRKHAVVIGAGFGGLAAAIRLGARGYRVTVVDKLESPGGRAFVYRDQGFVFDAGPTLITAPFLFEELWALCGKKLSDDIDMRPISPFYRIRFDDGHVFEYTGDAESMRREVARLSPGDVAGYERFVETSRRIFSVGFEQLADVPFGSWTSMAKIAPDMIKLESYRTVYGLVSKHVKDDRLRQVLSRSTRSSWAATRSPPPRSTR